MDITIRCNSELFAPLLFPYIRRGATVEVSPSIEGFEIIQEGQAPVTGTERRDMLLALRDLSR